MSIKRHKMSLDEINIALSNSHWGVLSLASKEGEPYGVPLNYAYDEEHQVLYFHCKPTGKKLKLIKENPNAHFSIIAFSELIAKSFVTHYDSVMLSGEVSFIEDDDKKHQAILLLCDQLAPLEIARRDAVIEKEWHMLTILCFHINVATGKVNRDL